MAKRVLRTEPVTTVPGEVCEESDGVCPVCGAPLRDGTCVTQVAGSGAWSLLWHGTVAGFFDRAAELAALRAEQAGETGQWHN